MADRLMGPWTEAFEVIQVHVSQSLLNEKEPATDAKQITLISISQPAQIEAIMTFKAI